MPLDPELANKFVRHPKFQALEPQQQFAVWKEFLSGKSEDYDAADNPVKRSQVAGQLLGQFEPGLLETIGEYVPIVGETIRAARSPEETRPLTRKFITGVFGPEAEQSAALRGTVEAVRGLVENAALLFAAGPIGRGVAAIAGRALPALTGTALNVVRAAAEGGSDLALWTLGQNVERVAFTDQQLNILQDLIIDPAVAGTLGAVGGIAFTGLFRGFLDDATRLARSFEATGMQREAAAELVTRGMRGSLTDEEFTLFRHLTEENPRILRSEVGQQILTSNREQLLPRAVEREAPLTVHLELADGTTKSFVRPAATELKAILEQVNQGNAFITYAEGKGATQLVEQTVEQLTRREAAPQAATGPLIRDVVTGVPEERAIVPRRTGETYPLNPPQVPEPPRFERTSGRALGAQEELVTRATGIQRGVQQATGVSPEQTLPLNAPPTRPAGLLVSGERGLVPSYQMTAEQVASSLPIELRALARQLGETPSQQLVGRRFSARTAASDLEGRVLETLPRRQKAVNVRTLRADLGLPNTPDVNRQLTAARKNLIGLGFLDRKGVPTAKARRLGVRGLIGEERPPIVRIPEGTAIRLRSGQQGTIIESNELFSRIQLDDGTVTFHVPKADGTSDVPTVIMQQQQRIERQAKPKPGPQTPPPAEMSQEQLLKKIDQLDAKWMRMKDGPRRDAVRQEASDLLDELQGRFERTVQRESAEGNLADQFREGCD